MARSAIFWVLTDSHFGQKETIGKFFNRPENYTEIIIKNLAYKICSQDLLLHLGDIGDDKNLKEILDSIECKSKVLIRGNHDKRSNNWYLSNGFSLVCDSLVIGEVLLSHIPINPKYFQDGIKWNLHGHLHYRDDINHWMDHEKEIVKYYDKTKHVLYALEYENYNLLCLQELVFKLNQGKWKYGDRLI